MIFEMRTYTLQPGSVPEVEKRWTEALTERVKVSPLGAFFHTEVGPLNRIIHIWPYDDLQHRTRVRSQSIPNWPPKAQEFIVEMESKIVIAAPFCPAFTAFGTLSRIALRERGYTHTISKPLSCTAREGGIRRTALGG